MASKKTLKTYLTDVDIYIIMGTSPLTERNTMEKTIQTFIEKCGVCKKIFEIEADPSDMKKWLEGELIQDVLGYLDDGQRELLISGCCGDCFDDWIELDDDETIFEDSQ